MSIADPAASGYVRFPRAWLTLEVSPGAKVLLLHLCAAANEAGESWHRYAKIGQVVGRSKAQISKYVAELIEAGVIETERQRTANGFEAHLLIRLVGWNGVVRRWSRMSRARAERQAAASAPAPDVRAVPATERGVSAAERKYPSGTNKPHQNDSAPAEAGAREVDWTEEDERAWTRVRPNDADPGLAFDRRPDDRLLERVVEAHRALEARRDILGEKAREAAARQALEAFCARRKVVAEPDRLAEAAQVVASRVTDAAGIARAVALIEAVWRPHWRRLSSPEQLRATLDEPGARRSLLDEAERLRRRFASRSLAARRELESRARSRARIAACGLPDRAAA